MEHATRQATWRVTSVDSLVWEEWETGFTVYDGSTGETHLLSPLPAETIRLLGDASMTSRELSHRMAALCEVDCTPEWIARMELVMRELASLSLVEKQDG